VQPRRELVGWGRQRLAVPGKYGRGLAASLEHGRKTVATVLKIEPASAIRAMITAAFTNAAVSSHFARPRQALRGRRGHG
jgi:hypothetical protein